MSSPRVRVLVVEDSLTIRRYIVDALSGDPRLEVVGEAGDGKTAIEQCQGLRPDVITMDMMLPIMTGVAATEHIMAFCPTPILIVSSSTNRGELFRTYDALCAGAVDVLDKPSGGETDHDWERRLVDAVRMVARIRVIMHPRGRLSHFDHELSAVTSIIHASGAAERKVVAIGASTGGPAALRSILSLLPKDFPLPILLVIHISEPFGIALAEWLDGQTALPVRYALDGERLPEPGEGCVLMAPPERHLELVEGRLHLSNAPERHSCRPSVDVLFESLARELAAQTIACLLTGMGKDGAQGLLAIHQHGGLTLAQDEASSVVFGMPAAAIKLQAASHVLPINEFGPFLRRATSKTKSEEDRRG